MSAKSRKFCLRVFGVRTNVVKGSVWSEKTSQNAGITPVGIMKKIPMLLNIHNMTVPPQNPENEQIADMNNPEQEFDQSNETPIKAKQG